MGFLIGFFATKNVVQVMHDFLRFSLLVFIGGN